MSRQGWKYLLLLFCLKVSSIKGEVIANRKIDNHIFGLWKVSCEDDEMLEQIRCVLFCRPTIETLLVINPYHHKPLLLLSGDSYIPGDFFLRVDNQDLVVSKGLRDERYKIINFAEKDIITLLQQLQHGNNLYLRFRLKDMALAEGFREVTSKLPLKEFQKALLYYQQQLDKYKK
jgi:hypothetical protein